MSKEELLKYLIAEIDLIMHDKDYRFENANGTWYSRESCRDLTNEEVFEELRTELRQFADLEAKLAESEKSKESYRLQNEQHHLQLLQFYSRLGVEAFGADIHEKALETLMIMKEQLAEKDKQIAELKKQLEEKEKDNQFLKKMYLSERTKNNNYHTEKYGLDKPVEELRKIKLTPKEKEIYYKGFDNCERQFATHIVELQQQLAEKDKEISEYVKIVDDLHKQLSDKCDFCDKTKDQDKISFALEQLEKVREEMDLRPRGVSKGWKNKEYDTLVEEDVYEVIDNQIKQLKEGK